MNAGTSRESAVPRKRIRINGRFFLILLLSFVAAGAVTYALHSVQVKRSAESLRDLAGEAERAGDLPKAIAYLQQYLRFETADYDAKIKLADLVEAHSRDGRSLFYVATLLEDVLRNDPDRSDVLALRRRVVDLSIEIRRYGHALDHLTRLQKVKRDDHKLVAQEAVCHFGLGEYQTAIFRLLRAIELSPTTIDHYVQLAATISFRPESMPHHEVIKNDPLAGKLDPRLIAWFPRLAKEKVKPGKEEKRKTTGKAVAAAPVQKTAAAKNGSKSNNRPPDPPLPAVAARTQAEAVIEVIYANLVKDGKPDHLALLAHASHLVAGRRFPEAKTRIDQAQKIAANDPDVLFAASTYATSYAHEQSLRDTSKDVRRKLLDEAERFAGIGAKLPVPGNLRFLLQLAEIEQDRATSLADTPDRRSAHLAKAAGLLNRCEKELAEFRKSDKARKRDVVNALRRDEIGLLSQQIDLTFRSSAVGEALSETDRRQVLDLTGRLQRLGASPAQLELVVARRLLSERSWRKALQGLTRVRASVGQSTLLRRQIDLALLTCLNQLQDPLQQIVLLQQSLATDIHWTEGRVMLAALLQSRGAFDEASQQFHLAGRELAVAAITLQRIARLPAAERAAALAQVRKFLDQPQLDATAVALLRGQVIALDPAKAKTRYQEIAALLDAAIKRDPANKVLRAARVRLELHPSRTDIPDKSKRLAAAFQKLDQYGARIRNSRELLVLRAQLCTLLPPETAKQKLTDLLKRVPSKDKAAGKGAKPAPPLTEDDRIAVLEAVARGFAALGLFEDCRNVWDVIAALVPDHLRVHLAAAKLDLQLRDWKRFDQTLKQVDRIDTDPDNPRDEGGAWGDFLRARRLQVEVAQQVRAAQGDPKKPVKLTAAAETALRKSIDRLLNDAKQLLGNAVKRQPLWPELHEQLGRIERSQGNREAAFQHYDRAFELGGYSASTCLYVVNYLRFDKRDRDAADDRLRRIRYRAPHLFRPSDVSLSDGSVSLMELWIDHAVRRKEFGTARSLFPEKTDDFRNKIIYSNILFQEYLSLTDPEKQTQRGKDLLQESQAKLREAMKDKPDAPEPWLTLVLQFAARDRVPDALKAVDEAVKALPANVRYVTAARCYILLGKSKQAEEQFLNAIKARPQEMGLRLILSAFYFSRNVHARALPHLKLVLAPGSPATASQREVARSQQIIAIASSGKYADYQRALSMLKPVAKAPLPDLVTRIRVLQTSPFKRDGLALIGVMEEIDRRFKMLKDSDRFQLARLYERAGRWKDARKLAEELRQRNAKDPLLLGWYIVESLKNEKKTEDLLRDVRSKISMLQGLDPGTLAIATVRAELALAEGKPKDAAKAIDVAVRQVGTVGAKPNPADLAKLILAARYSEKNKLVASAEAAYRRYARLSGKPAAELSVATFLSRQGRPTEALRIIHAAQKACKPVEVAVAAANVVSVGKPSADNLATAEAIVAAAAKADPKSLQIRWQSATVKTAAGKLDEAQAVYNALLKEAPGNAAILNNVAWLLAMRNEDLPRARVLIEQVIVERGPLGEFLDTRGLVYLRMQEPGRALTDFQQAAEETDDPEKHLHVAQSHLALRNRPAAVEAMRQARKLGLRYNRIHQLEHEGCRAAATATGVEISD